MTQRTWGAKSASVLSTLDPRLQRLMTRIRDEVADVSLLYGFRGKEEQDLFYATGRSKLPWPTSKHNSTPSLAVDFVTSPVNLKSAKLREELAYVAGAAIAIAREEGYTLRWGGDWDRDGDLEDQKFDDLFHLEIHEDHT